MCFDALDVRQAHLYKHLHLPECLYVGVGSRFKGESITLQKAPASNLRILWEILNVLLAKFQRFCF